jgi:hypothetical protein
MLDKIARGIGNTIIAYGCRLYCATSGETIVTLLLYYSEHRKERRNDETSKREEADEEKEI